MRPLFFLFLFLFSIAWADPGDKELKELKRIQDENAKILAETHLEVGQLRQEIQALKGVIEETRYFFQQESEKNGKVLRDFDFRFTGLEERLSLHQKQLEELLARPAGKAGDKEDEESAYKRALTAINLGNFREAQKGFEDFLKKFPKSSLADNAQYWKGEALYAQKDFTGALVEFQKVVKNHPRSEKAAGSLLKQGFCLFEQQSYADAKIFLNKLVEQYPKSDEAAEARERIQKIDQILSKMAPPPPVTSSPPAPPPAGGVPTTKP